MLFPSPPTHLHPKADDGSRRWWVCHTDDIDIQALLSLPPEWFEQLWRQVYRTLYLPNPQGFRLTFSERETLQKRNAQHRKTLPCEDEIRTAMNFDCPVSSWTWKTTSTIKNGLNLYVDTRLLGRTLAKIVSDEKPKADMRVSRGIKQYLLPPLHMP